MDAEESQPSITEQWKTKRKWTLFLAVVHSFSYGFTFMLLQTTLWTYLNDELHVENPALYYGLNCAGFYLFIITCGIPFSSWFDNNKQLRRTSLLTALLILFGNTVYIIPHEVCTVVGSISMGVASLQTAAYNSEILRVYPPEDIQSKYSLTLLTTSVGDMVAGGGVKLLEKIDFQLAGLHVRYGNSIGLVLACFSLVRLALTCMLARDVSKEFDLKAWRCDEKKSQQQQKTSYLEKMQSVLNIDMTLVFLHQCYSGFWTILCLRILPLITHTLSLSNTVLDICYIIEGFVLGFVILLALLLNKATSTTTDVYYFGLFNILIMFLVQILIFVIPMLNHHLVSLILVLVISVGTGLMWVTEMVYIVITLGKLTPSSCQTSVESTREIARLLPALVASFASVYIYERYVYFLPISLFLVVMIFVGTILRQKSLKDTKLHSSEEELSLLKRKGDDASD